MSRSEHDNYYHCDECIDLPAFGLSLERPRARHTTMHLTQRQGYTMSQMQIFATDAEWCGFHHQSLSESEICRPAPVASSLQLRAPQLGRIRVTRGLPLRQL